VPSPIPATFPTVLGDRFLHALDETGAAETAIRLELRFAGRLDLDRLTRAADLLLDAEPVLGCRYVRDERKPFWERVGADRRDVVRVVADAGEYARCRVAPIDSYEHPQVRLFVWRAADGDRVLLAVAHIAADAGGVKHAVGRLAAIYQALATEPDHVPEPNVDGERDYTQVLRRLPRRALLRVARNYLRHARGMYASPPVHGFGFPDGPRHPIAYALRDLAADRVARIAAFGRARGATLNDLLVAAYFRAFADTTAWDGARPLRLQTTVDLRRWYLPGERAGGVCNLSSFEFPGLGRDLGATLAETVDRVHAITRRRKGDWFGLTDVLGMRVFRFSSYRRLRRSLIWVFARVRARGSLCPTFTNMGDLRPETVAFDEPPAAARLLVPVMFPPFFVCGASGYAGGITLSAGVPEFLAARVEAFFDAWTRELPE
jgi:NRPS condensation-like uncharacterized protein